MQNSTVEIANAANEVEAKPKTVAAAAVTLGYDFEALDETNDIFIRHEFTRNGAVKGFVFFRQGLFFCFLFRQYRIGVNFGNPLVSCVGIKFRLNMYL